MSDAREPQTQAEILGEIGVALERRKALAFPLWLERRFEIDTGKGYGRLLFGDMVKVIFFYNFFLLGDFLLTPDTVVLAAALHAFFATPAMLGALWLFRRGAAPFWRDLATGATPVVIAVQTLIVFCASASRMVEHYPYFIIMTTISTNTALRMRNRAAKWATYSTLALTAFVLIATQKLPFGLVVIQCFSLGVCGVVTLNGNFDREREFRRSYLRGLADRFKFETADAASRSDALTGIANRRALEEAAKQIWRTAPQEQPVTVILFDVDNFKAYNDLLGHPAGDACLKAVAGAAARALADSPHFLARYGGEEFVALATATPEREGVALAERLRVALAELGLAHPGAGERKIVTASFGVASAPAGAADFAALVAVADCALYAAKRAGRNAVRARRPGSPEIKAA